MTHLTCKACGATLTRNSRWGRPSEYDPRAVDRAPTAPAGVMIRLDEEDTVPVFQGDRVAYVHLLSPVGSIAVHPDDVLPGSMASHGVDNGCCGSDGMDGPNRICSCGAVLGTEWSDCWTQAEVRFLPDAVVEAD